jgi:hypothetical protein
LANGPSCSICSINGGIKSERIVQEKSEKVKPTPAELASARHDAITATERFYADKGILRTKREAQKKARQRGDLPPLPTPQPTEKAGFPSYVASLERADRALFRTEFVGPPRPQDGPHDDAQAAAGGSAEGRLGNLTELRAGFSEVICQKTGEIQRLRVDEKRRELVADNSALAMVSARKFRFAAQRTAADLLGMTKTPRQTVWRVVGCARRRVGPDVAVMHSPRLQKAHFAGLMVCGSVWTCPPCAAKVSERRKDEIVKATDTHKASGGALYMVTHTFAHERTDDLGDTMVRLTNARQHMRRQRAYRELLRSMGFVGDIRTLEVTYGDANGWHPHEHNLWLVAKPLTDRQQRTLRSTLFDLWKKACQVSGLGTPNRKNGVNVIEADSAAEYMAKFGREPKWGVASELTKQHVKTGKAKSMTPFDLLRAAHDGESRFGALFVQFAAAFFGKSQVRWSRGLKAAFGIDEMTDEQLAAVEAEDATVIIRMTPLEWRKVLEQSFDQRTVLLELAEAGGYLAVRRYLDGLVSDLVGPYGWRTHYDD